MAENPGKLGLLKDGFEVWSVLKSEGGLNPKLYDEPLIEELRDRLNLSPEEDFDEVLSDSKISTEKFIVAFFQTIQPFSEMMSDLLKMFEKAGAKRSNKNIFIRFNFSEDLPELSFDLSKFREWIEIWTKIRDIFIAYEWDYKSLWSLNKVLHVTWDIRVQNEEMEKWCVEYKEFKKWPNFIPPAPKSGVRELDDTLKRIWDLWETICTESSKYGINRKSLHRIAFDREDKHNYGIEDQKGPRHWDPKLLGRIDHDNWAGLIARGAYCNAEIISGLLEMERIKKAKELKTKLEKIIEQLPQKKFRGEFLTKTLLDFLNLPIWQKRHELYSVWISTQIINSLENAFPRIHQINGTLKFSFSGTHLATVDSVAPQLHLWAELRSPLKKPVGKSRKKAIQPDYSLVLDPITSPESSIFEVECKQYLRPSARNFSAALTDYAKGRPNAHVVLVNYGKVNPSILEKVNTDVRHRTSLIGNMRPGSEAAQQEFKQLIQKTINKRFNLREIPQSYPINPGSTGKISLFWDKLPSDLDLHLKIKDSKDDWEIYYSQKGNMINSPFVELGEDIQEGFGPENINIAKWLDGTYHCAVYNYSDDFALPGCGARLVFETGKYRKEFICPGEGTGRWWSVFNFDVRTGILKEINGIVEFLEMETIFDDNFMDNRNNWPESEDYVLKVGKGKYRFEHKRDSGSWFSWKPLKINQKLDFEIECEIKKISGNADGVYELLWGFKDMENYFSFGIRGDGSYIIQKRKDDKFTSIIDWSESSHINKYDNINKVRLKKIKDALHFYINDHFIKDTPFEQFFGQKIGFRLENKIAIDIKHISIRQSQ